MSADDRRSQTAATAQGAEMTEQGTEMLRKLLGEERASEVRGVVQAFARLRSPGYEFPRRRNLVAAQPRSQDAQSDYGRGAHGAGPRERAAPEP